MALSVFVLFQIFFAILILIKLFWNFWSKKSCPNPFAVDDRKPRKQYITDQRKRDEILKQSFSMQKVPTVGLDAIIIGSGIGGLSTAAIMAKSGKKVLVLEQHDQAGGCCHTFIDKGYEFDVGIHYIGQLGHTNMNKTFVDQICDGQLEWNRLHEDYDVVSIGYGDDRREFPVKTGFDNWRAHLKTQFPEEEHAAIEKYFKLIAEYSSNSKFQIMMKFFPLWIAKIICSTPLVGLFTKLWTGSKNKSTLEVAQSLTKNKDLQTIFCYCWGDYGTIPSMSHFSMHALLVNHYKNGAFYPVGGASEIALNIIPVIERSGGKVLVKADVQEILHNGDKVYGVLVKKGIETYKIEAPMVISSAGLYNTFQKLLPPNIGENSYFHGICKNLKPAYAAMNVFLGFDASNEELGLKAQSIWAFTTNDSADSFTKYCELGAEEALDAQVPLLFISFPSAKDPNWINHPGRENKSTCAIVTLATWEWFKQWESQPVKRRGDDYDAIKNTIGEMMVEQLCKLYPQVRDHIDYKDFATPITNKHYIAQPYGELYGLDHTAKRMEPLMAAKLRPETDIPGLYLTGQDILSCGFTGALYSGILTASVVLKRNAMIDLVKLHKKLKANEKSKIE